MSLMINADHQAHHFVMLGMFRSFCAGRENQHSAFARGMVTRIRMIHVITE
jgi:hypothetical protein